MRWSCAPVARTSFVQAASTNYSSSPSGMKITVLASQLMQHDIAIIRQAKKNDEPANK